MREQLVLRLDVLMLHILFALDKRLQVRIREVELSRCFSVGFFFGLVLSGVFD